MKIQPFSRSFGVGLIEVLIVVVLIGVLAAVIIPNLAKKRTHVSMHSCLFNLMWIEQGKQEWAKANKRGAEDVPSASELKPILLQVVPRWQTRRYDDALERLRKSTNNLPLCSSGGSYTLGKIGERPACSARGHEHGTLWDEAIYQQSYGGRSGR